MSDTERNPANEPEAKPQGPRKPRKRTATGHQIELRQREARCVAAWSAGATLEAIAEQEGYADASGAMRAIRRAIDKRPAQDVESERVRAEGRLNDIHRRAVELFLRPHPMLYKGQIVRDEQGNLVEDLRSKSAALELIRRVEVDHWNLWGLGAAHRVEVTGADGGPIPLAVIHGEVLARLENVLALKAEGKLIELLPGAAVEIEPFDEQADEG